MTPPLVLAALHAPVTVLGRGRRLGLWVQGCRQRCPDCLAPGLQPETGGQIWPLAALTTHAAGLVRGQRLDGVTISGGEPLLQWAALRDFVRELVRLRPGLDVLVYTGYVLRKGRFVTADAPAGDPGFVIPTDWFDVLVDGPWQEKEADSEALRGSKNQRILPFTKRGRRLAASLICPRPGAAGRQYFRTPDGIFIAGIPAGG